MEQLAVHHFFHDAAHREVIAAKQSARAEDHHQDQHQRIDHHAVALEASGRLGQDGKDSRRQDGAEHRAHAAQNDHNKDLDGLHEAEGRRIEDAQIAGVQAASQTCESSGEGERHDLIISSLDAAALSSDLVITDSQDRAAMTGFHHGVDSKAGDDDTEEDVPVVGIFRDVFQALCAVEQLEAQHIVDVVQGDTDDLAEAQSQDGEVVTGQAKSRDADEDTKDASHDGTQCQTDRKCDTGGQVAVFREQRTGVCTDSHETGVTQRQLAQITGGDVQGDGQNDIDADAHHDLILIGREDVLGHEGQQNEAESHQNEVHQVAHRHFQGFAFCIHFPNPPLHLFLHLTAKETGGLDQQNDDQNRERDGVLPSGQADRRDEALTQADGDAADHGTGDRTDAAQNGCNEGFQAQHGAHSRGRLRIGAAVQDCADTSQSGTDCEGEGDGAVDIDAHQTSGVHIFRDGAHGLAELGLLDEEGQDQHGQDGDDQRDDGGQAQRNLADVEGLGVVVGRNDLCTRAHDQLSGVLEEEGDANCCDKQRDTGCGAQRRVSDFLNYNAQQGTGNDGRADCGDRAKPQLVHNEPRHVRTYHDDVAVSKVQQQDDTVNHAVAQRDQRVDAAKGKTVDQLTEKHCHGLILPFQNKKAETVGQTCSGGLRNGSR